MMMMMMMMMTLSSVNRRKHLCSVFFQRNRIPLKNQSHDSPDYCGCFAVLSVTSPVNGKGDVSYANDQLLGEVHKRCSNDTFYYPHRDRTVLFCQNMCPPLITTDMKINFCYGNCKG